jgi:hypothetical protein
MNKTIVSTSIFDLKNITEIEINYSRPFRNGRKIFGELVPFNQPWKTGANNNSTIFFSKDVMVDGQLLKKGKYALFTIPGEEYWQVIFYTNYDNWGVPRTWESQKVALITEVRPTELAHAVESVTIAINHYNESSASLEISWEHTLVAVNFHIPDQLVYRPAHVNRFGGGSANEFYAGAMFHYQTEFDLPGALDRINIALELSDEKPYFYHRLQSLILAKLGDTDAAIATAELSLVAALVANDDYYIKSNQGSIKAWTKI